MAATASPTASRDFDQGFEIFCQKCGHALVRYYLSGPKAGTETTHICRCEVRHHTDMMMPQQVRIQEIRPEHRESPLLDCFDKSVVVRGNRMDVLSVVKYWWYGHNSRGGKNVMLVPDSYIRDLGFGEYSKKNRSDDYVGVTYNTIDDFVVPPDLLIIQMGVIQTGAKGGHYQSKLYEAIYARFCSTKPLWILVKPGQTFSHAYYPYVWSENSEEVVGRFPVVDAVPRQKGAPEPTDLRPDPGELRPDPVGEDRPRREKPARRVRSAPDDDAGDGAAVGLSMYGSGVTKKKGLRSRD